jgi:hypothetical protein
MNQLQGWITATVIVAVVFYIVRGLLEVLQYSESLRSPAPSASPLLRGQPKQPPHTYGKGGVLIDSTSVPMFLPLETTSPDASWREGAVRSRRPDAVDMSSKRWEKYSRAVETPPTDVWMYETFFFGMERGIIVESGGLDGLEFSNSYLFEEFATWTSILVEADSRNFRKMVANRPRAFNIHAALCNASTVLHYYERGDCCSGIVELQEKMALELYRKRVDIKSLPKVHCISMTHVLRKLLAINKVDIWVLDVEGAEESVLSNTDFDAVQFNLVVYETRDGSDEEMEVERRKLALMERNGFKCYTKMDKDQVSNNLYCVNSKFTPNSAPNSTALVLRNGTNENGTSWS